MRVVRSLRERWLRERQVSKGTSSGLLDEVKAQSVLKHAILDSYIIRFAIMTASKIPSKRAVLLDGFAGRGRYPDGTPASGERMLLAAQRAKNSAQVDVVLVEREPKDYEQLDRVANEYRQRGVNVTAHCGDVQDHLAEVLVQAANVPLFLFLDPCGANVPFDSLRSALAENRRRKWPPTEALLNISADLTRRAAGVVNKGQVDHKVIPRMTTMCGGDWWKQVALDAYATSGDGKWEASAEAVVNRYAQMLGNATQMVPIVVPVHRRAHHQPVYHLVFLTRREHGRWVFGDALALARLKWMRALGPDEDEAEGMLFNLVEDQIESEEKRSVTLIKDNMLALVAHQSRVKLVDHTADVFGETYGVAPERLVRRAARELQKDDQISLNAKPKQARDWEIWV